MSGKYRAASPPEDEPPPYSEIVTDGSITLETSGLMPVGAVQHYRPPTASSDNNPLPTRHSTSTHGPTNPALPPRPHSQYTSSLSQSSRPGRPSHESHQYQNQNQTTSSRPNHDNRRHHGSANSASRPPPPGPRPSGSTYYGPQHNNGPYMSGSRPQPPPMQSMPPPNSNPHLRYPRGYWCPKCNNTGIKTYKGTTCQDCYEMFGVSRPAHYMPYNASPVFQGPPRVVNPGDPSIGGTLCGRCRGSGFIYDMLIFESTCPLCHGVGRMF